MPKSKKKTKLPFHKIIFAIIVISILIFFYFFSQANRNSSNISKYSDPIEVVKSPDGKSKMYTNSKYKYSIEFPSTIKIYGSSNSEGEKIDSKDVEVYAKSQNEQPLATTNFVGFDTYDHAYFGAVPFTIQVLEPPFTDTYFDSETLDKIFSLKVGENLDEATSKKINPGGWSLSTDPMPYKKLPNHEGQDYDIVMIESPRVYGGKLRFFLIKKNGMIFLAQNSYNNQKDIDEFMQFITSLKFD